jgi:hypothetical protein
MSEPSFEGVSEEIIRWQLDHFRERFVAQGWLDTNSLMLALEQSADEPIPERVLDYIRGRLDQPADKRDRRRRRLAERVQSARKVQSCLSSLADLDQTLARRPKARIATETLIAALVENAREALPEPILNHLRDRLDRVALQRRGPKFGKISHQIQDDLMLWAFRRFKQWLEQRQATRGLNGWPRIREADWWQGPPSERAIRMARQKWARTVDWRTAQERIYASRKRHGRTG